jgi:endonuclease/exonuclease/phosphatase family metal-dependent hydrolase
VHDESLRLMTYNVLSATKKRRTHPWRLRKRMIARNFRQYQPHVVGTQEANLFQLNELRELLPEYDFIGEGNLSGTRQSDSPASWYCAIFYRRDVVRPDAEAAETYWHSPTPRVPGSQFHLGTRPRLVTWQPFKHLVTGQDFVFGTTHLEALNRWHRHKSAKLLVAQVERTIRQRGAEVPIFLTGDFNAVSGSPEIRRLAGSGQPGTFRSPRRRGLAAARLAGPPVFYDAWLETGLDEAFGATFRGLGRWRQIGHSLLGPRRIDYIFFRPRLEVLSVRRIGYEGLVSREMAMPSDHFPVMAEFRLASPAWS